MKVNFMLIDDDIIDLFINEKNIEKLELNSKIKSFTSGDSAIDYLKEIATSENLNDMFVPDFILLDINMPKMNGFQFMHEFRKLSDSIEKDIKVYMLSVSNNTKFIDNAKSGRFCNGFIQKPLTVEKLDAMIENFELSVNEYHFEESI
ncbi:response regulator [Algibacter sp. R77976]|uniref:response regulator n=1 Tax=Algibacter sp. R77976 TaxID=3093873 RepID=UPI0037CA2B32